MYIHFVHALYVERVEASAQLERSWPRLADTPAVFAGVTYTFEDDRLEYPEQRFVTLGLLKDVPGSIGSYRDCR